MMELRWDNAYKDFTTFLEHNRCSTGNPASSNPLSLFLSPPSPFYYSYFLPFSSTEFLEKEKTRGATSGKTSLFLVGLWLLWFCDMDCSHRCWPCLLTNTDFFFLAVSRRKDQNVLSPVNCWNLLLNQVKRESRDHTTLSDIYLNNIIPRFVQVSEDSGRLFKKVNSYF